MAPHLFYPVFLMKVLCFALFACAFNLLLGYVGLLSYGHAAFFGSAGYITAHMVKALNFSPISGILIGVAVSALLGLVIGWLAIRRSGIYFAMITLGFAQVIYFLSLQLDFTGGEDGIQGVPRGSLLGLVDLNDTIGAFDRPFTLCRFFCLHSFSLDCITTSPSGTSLMTRPDSGHISQ